MRIPVRPVPEANSPSTMPSSLTSSFTNSSTILIAPELVKLRLAPPSRLTPVALSISAIFMAPALDRALSEFRVTAGPSVVTVIIPVVSIVRS